MDVSVFWQIIETTHAKSHGDNEQQFELLVEALTQETNENILEFERIFYTLHNVAYHANLWEAADVIACGCSDDGFMDFRTWLIAQGKVIFESAIDDPESLVDVVDEEHRFDVLRSSIVDAAEEAYQLRNGEAMPTIVYGSSELVGKVGPEKQRVSKFPRLSAKLGSCDGYY